MVVVVLTAHVLTVVATMLPTGLVDYDWSNAKLEWANESPMDCDGSLVRQAARNKAQNPTAKVFVYRNIVKALAWYTEVRKLLQDQSYWGFFIPYAGCRSNITGAYVCKNRVTGEIDATANLYISPCNSLPSQPPCLKSVQTRTAGQTAMAYTVHARCV